MIELAAITAAAIIALWTLTAIVGAITGATRQ
jgi:hypothetical protein